MGIYNAYFGEKAAADAALSLPINKSNLIRICSQFRSVCCLVALLICPESPLVFFPFQLQGALWIVNEVYILYTSVACESHTQKP